MRNLLVIIVLLWMNSISAQVLLPGGTAQLLSYDLNLAGCNYGSYFAVYDFAKSLGQITTTPAPEGYEAFYISTYARHGSRWLGGAKSYDTPIATLKSAAAKKQLTEKGQQLLRDLQQLRAKSPKESLAQLTDVGEDQHTAIAKRLCANYPSVFDVRGEYFAQASTVKRCQKSMAAEAAIIESVSGAHVTQASGRPGMQDRLAACYSNSKMDSLRKKGWSAYSNDYARLTPYKRIIQSLFSVTPNMTVQNQKKLVHQLFDLASNMQSHRFDIDLWKYFNKNEVDSLFTIVSREWYYVTGASPLTGGLMPLRGKYQLQDILEGADSVVNRRLWHGTNLRFGHDVNLAPLACLMELGTCGRAVPEDQMNTLEKVWRMTEISPMAGNIQLIFCRPKNGVGDVLVKALLNEREVSLPGVPVCGPYYRWKDISAHWRTRIHN